MGNRLNQSSLSISILPAQSNLFDFHKQINKKVDKSSVVFPSYLKHNNVNKVQYSQRSHFNERQYEINLSTINNQLVLCLKRQALESQKIWKVLDVNETIEIKEKDIIKLGETQFIIKKICKNYHDLDLNSNLKTVSDLDYYQQGNNLSSIIQKSCKLQASKYLQKQNNNKLSTESLLGDSSCCRVCFSKAINNRNPLLNLCKCTGSIKNIHFQCLKSWIKHTSKQQSCDSYEYIQYNLSCDICKTKIDKTIIHNNKKFTIYSDYLNHPPFVILGYKNDNSHKVRQYIINFDHKDNLLLGRGKNCDIPFMDRFISKQHCQLIYENSKLFLRNLNPSFGTFINFKEYILISNIQLMIKNTLIKIQKQNDNCCSTKALKICLLQDEIQDLNSYQ